MGNNKRSILILSSILFVVIVAFIGVTYTQVNSEKIAKNTYVNGVNISGKTKDEAKKILSTEYKPDDIEFSFKSKKWKIDHDKIDFTYDLDDTVKKAYELNRNDGFLKNLIKTVKTNFGQKNNIVITYEYNKQKLKTEITKIAKEVDVAVEDASLKIADSSITVNPEKNGYKLNVDKTIKGFENKITKGEFKDSLVVEVIEPNVKQDQLSSVDTLLGSYSTRFDSNVAGRTENIRISASRTSDVLLMPGESFSYNGHTGERSIANGYKNAPVIVQGVVQEGVGGGVCQVSSTLYNSVLYSGLEIVKIQNHSIPSTYVSKGRDATVADGGIDFVFKNNLSSPVYVRNYVDGNIVTCQIFGSSKDKQNIDIEISIDGSSQSPVKKVDDPTLPKGKEEVLENGRNSYTVSTYRIYKDSNGKVIKKEKVYKSYYPKKQTVIAVGTKEEEKQPEQVENNNTNNNNNNNGNNNGGNNNDNNTQTPPPENDNTETPNGNAGEGSEQQPIATPVQ